MSIFINTLIVLLAIAGTEFLAIITHKYIMHGPGWSWHQSHHEPKTGFFEKNDLYAVVFSAFAMGLFVLGSIVWKPAFYVAIGMTIYGVLYSFVHDGLVHKRLPINITFRRGYLKRLTQAHKLHHATHTKEGSVSFGFLWAQDIPTLKRQMKQEAYSGR